MIRARFKCNHIDPRPVNWPIKHPYWVSGYGDRFAVVVAYADDEAELLRNWPDATEIDSEVVGLYAFTSRFKKPDWFDGDKP